MEVTIGDIKRETKEFILTSFDFFKRKYLRKRALNGIQDFENFPETILQNAGALFVLSTGRCGTDFLNHVLKSHNALDVHHEDDTRFTTASRYLYEHRDEISRRGGELAFLAGRYHDIQDAYLLEKIYVETNNRLTFFAPYIQSLMPRARFVHLVRHPGDFVRSGMRRNYYTPHRPVDYSKIRPADTDKFHQEWSSYSRIEKISWLWYKTNLFIEEFKAEHPEKVLFVKSEQLFKNPEDVVLLIGNFLDIDIEQPVKIEIGPKNVQKTGSFPHYENWSTENKEKMKVIVGELAAKYDYRL